MNHQPDALIFADFQKGDSAAFGKIYDALKHDIYSRAYALTQHGEDARDLLQEVFIRAYRERAAIQSGEQMKAWLYKVLYRLAIDLLRRNKLRRADYLNDDVSSQDGQGKEEGLDPALSAALKALPDETRMMLVMFEVEGLPQPEIAKLFGCSLSKVQTDLHRARKELRERLKKME